MKINDISSLSDTLNSICSFAVSKNQKEAHTKVYQAFISVVSLINTNNFRSLLELFRGDTKKEPSNYYFNAINEAAKKLATVKETKQATYKLAHLLDLVKCKEEKDENENSQDQDQKENTSNKKEDSENQKNVEIVNKNINSDIFQSLFDAINKCYPLLDNKNEFHSDNFNKRNELCNTLFDSFLKVDKKLKGAMIACNSIVKKIMDDSSLSKIENENTVRSELEFLIRVIIDGRKKFSASSNKSIVTCENIKQLIDTIEKYFPSSEENDDNNRYELIKYLFELLKKQNIDRDVFQSLFDVINREFSLLSDDKNTMISLAAEKLKKRNELLGKLSEISVIADSKKNQAAQKQYFNTVKKMMNAYKSKFLGTNKIISEDKDENKNEKKKLTLESLIRMTILAQVKLSPQPTESKVKYKDIVELTDIIEKSFHSDSENDKNNRYDLIKCLFEQFSIVKDFSLPCNKILDGIATFATSSWGNLGTTFAQGTKMLISGKKNINDFLAKSGNKMSYQDILPAEIITAVNGYNKKLEKDQVDKKFDLDTQILNDIKKHNVIKKISKLNEIINVNKNVNKDNEKNPVISIFKFLSGKKFDLNSFLPTFQSNYLDTVVNLIGLGIKVLNQFITKQDVTKETGVLFKPEYKNKSENDKFNQSFVYNSKLKSINESIISNLIQQGIKKVVENLDKFFVKSFKNEKDENDENKDLINKEHQCNISQNKIDEVSKKITGVLLKKFGSVYGLVSKIKNVAEDVGKNKKYNTTASAIFDFVLDCINDENSEDVNLLPLLLELIDAFNFGDLKIEKDSAQSKKIVYNIINSFMGLIAFSKALNCDTEIFANDKNINNKKKTTDKLISLLNKMVDTKEFKGFVGKFLSDEYIEKIKQMLNNVAKLKFEDCAYLLCSDEILAQNKENRKENEKSEEKKNENTINVINEENDKNKLLDNKHLIKEENGKESKLDIILNQTVTFSWVRENENGGKTFFDSTKSLSDEKKIKEFEDYKKEKIKNDKTKKNKEKQISDDEKEITSVSEKKNDNQMEDALSKNNNDTNKINISIGIKKKEIEDKNDKKNDYIIQLENNSKIENNNMQMSVKSDEESNNELGSDHIKSESKIKAREIVEIKIESSLS